MFNLGGGFEDLAEAILHAIAENTDQLVDNITRALEIQSERMTDQHEPTTYREIMSEPPRASA